MTFTYKSINNLAYDSNYFNFINTTYPFRNIDNLRPPFMRSDQSQRSPAYYCCEKWNDLPPYIKARPSVSSFKLAVKKHLLNKYRFS